jgi:hypothetical protein
VRAAEEERGVEAVGRLHVGPGSIDAREHAQPIAVADAPGQRARSDSPRGQTSPCHDPGERPLVIAHPDESADSGAAALAPEPFCGWRRVRVNSTLPRVIDTV